MKPALFEGLLANIRGWGQTPCASEQTLILATDLSELTERQWSKLKELVYSIGVSAFGVYKGNTHNFSKDTWQALFGMCKELGINKLELEGELIQEYDETQWEIFFTQLTAASITTLEFFFSKF